MGIERSCLPTQMWHGVYWRGRPALDALCEDVDDKCWWAFLWWNTRISYEPVWTLCRPWPAIHHQEVNTSHAPGLFASWYADFCDFENVTCINIGMCWHNNPPCWCMKSGYLCELESPFLYLTIWMSTWSGQMIWMDSVLCRTSNKMKYTEKSWWFLNEQTCQWVKNKGFWPILMAELCAMQELYLVLNRCIFTTLLF